MTDAKDFFNAFKTDNKLCATKCCICHKPLTDTSSVEFGIGPTCRKNYKYDDAPVVTKESDVKALIEAIHATFPDQMASYLIKKIEGTKMTPTFSREIAKCTVYYASSVVGTAEAGRMIQCISVLRCLGYENLATRLLFKAYGHKLWRDVPFTNDESDDDGKTKEPVLPTFFYSGPFNATVNSYLKTQFNGIWEAGTKKWILRGDIMDCTALIISSVLGKLLPLPKIAITKKKLVEGKADDKPSTKEDDKSNVKKDDKPGVKLTTIGPVICIESPFNYKFKNQVKEQLKGTWDAKMKQWKVSTDLKTELQALIAEHYPKLSIIWG